MKVKIKDWYDMAEEFGIDEDGEVNCYCCFTTFMKRYCGKVIEVNDDEILIRNNIKIFRHNGWYFSDDMYEIIKE